MTKILYIVGNGFDLYHKMESSFSDFKDYVAKKNKPVFDAVERYLIPNSEKQEWNGLEQALGCLDPDEIIDEVSPFMESYGSEDWEECANYDAQFETEKITENLSSELMTLLTQWASQLNKTTPAHKTLNLDKDALYISFNYTDTLISTYEIPAQNILFIHGRESVNDKLIMGHSTHPQDKPLTEEQLEGEDPRLSQTKEIIRNYFKKTFKNTGDIANKHRKFFSKLTDIRKVIVLGHSLSDVDSEYYRTLTSIKCIASADWKIAIRDIKDKEDKEDKEDNEEKEEKEKAINRLKNKGIFIPHPEFIFWKDLGDFVGKSSK